jgi:hypothetical protein
VDEAARVLGLSVDAIRKRVQRGTIPYEKDPAGRVTILLDTVETVQDVTGHGHRRGAELEDLRDQVAFLRRELEARTEEARRKDHIIMSLTQRVPELEPGNLRDAPHGPETVAEEPEGVDAPTSQVDRETGAQRRSSWWRKFFGFE